MEPTKNNSSSRKLGIMKSVLVKVSGDLYDSESFITEIGKLAEKYFVVICVGGGKQINEAFVKVGIPISKHGLLGRQASSLQERQLARDVLEDNKARLQGLLAEKKIPAVVIIPVLDIGSVLCHVNGDQFLKTAYLGFDHLCVVTTPDRKEKKAQEFADFPKIEILTVTPD